MRVLGITTALMLAAAPLAAQDQSPEHAPVAQRLLAAAPAIVPAPAANTLLTPNAFDSALPATAHIALAQWPEKAVEMSERALEMAARAKAMQDEMGAMFAAKAATLDIARAGFLAQAAIAKRDRGDRDYRRGKSALDRRNWQDAIETFQEVIDAKGSQSEAALYWKAYALNKLGRRSEAAASLQELQKSYPSSGWLNDARALEAEVKQAAGQNTPPESEGDEDLKLLALNALVHSDPDRALPLIEKLLKSANSPKLKERALFVLAQTKSPRASQILLDAAKGASNPELQLKAVEYLGVMGGAGNGSVLAGIYQSSKDKNVRAAVIKSYLISRDKTRLLEAANTETDAALRREAIHSLGALRADQELARIYQSEQDPEVRSAVLRGFMMGNNSARLLEAARNEKDPKLEREAIRYLGALHDSNTSDALVGLYQSKSSPEARKSVIEALFIQQNAKALVDIARKETDPGLKRDAVQKLSLMKSKESTDYLMELLNK